MAQKLEDFAPELQDQLADGSQNIFLAAFNSARDNGMSQEGAMEVAWNTIKYDYEQGEDGKWHRKPQPSNLRYKATQSGGN